MRILFLVTDGWYFLSHRLHLAVALRERGCEVHVATDPGAAAGALAAAGLNVIPLRFARSVLGQARNALCLARLVRCYRRLRPDLVHHVALLPIVYGSLAARAAGVPAVVNAVPGLGYAFSARRPLLRATLERAYGFALRGSHVLFQNPDDAELFQRRGLLRNARWSVVPGAGVDTRRFAPGPEPEGVPVVLLCARMLWSKGPGLLLEASALLRARGLAHEIVLAGEPHASNPDAIPRAELERWHASGRARWLGAVADMAPVLRAATLVVLPSSYREGVPLALIEAAACGKALVTTDAPGCREIVRDGVNGLLVPARDAPALAQAIATLLADPARRAELGRAGRRLVEERFSTTVVNEAVLELYRARLGRDFHAPAARADLETVRGD